jgi:OOP family OmpA-OmpF porin
MRKTLVNQSGATMKRLILSAAFSLACFSQSASAEGFSGAYLGAGMTSNSLYSSCASGLWNSCNDPSTGPKDSGTFQLIGGYNIDKHFGVEATYAKLGTYNVLHAGTNVGEFRATAYTLALRGGNTFENGFSIHGKLGLSNVATNYTVRVPASWTLSGSTSQRSSGFVGGVAGQYNINNVIGFRVSLDLIKYTDSEFDNIVRVIGLSAVFKL